MIEISRATRESTAPAAAFFERWCDLPTHPQWAPSMEYFVLDGPFQLGATGRSRSVGGAETRFTVTEVGPGWVYADTTDLGSALLTVRHEATETDGVTTVTLTGLVDRDVDPELGPGLQTALEHDLESLAHLLEGDR